MRFTTTREDLLSALSLGASIVDRKQSLPALANSLLMVNAKAELSIVSTDLEVELLAQTPIEKTAFEVGEITVSARKVLDICRCLPEKSRLEFFLEDRQLVMQSGRSRYAFSTLSAKDFPRIDAGLNQAEFSISQQDLKRLISNTQFSMANQDVRYYLNGLMLDLNPERMRFVATDGHRLAFSSLQMSVSDKPLKIIIPRKAVLELTRLLNTDDAPVAVSVGDNHVKFIIGETIFTSKLIDGRFPDYDRVIPRGNDKVFTVERNLFYDALQRVSVLVSEKFQGVRFTLENNRLLISASTPDGEKAEEDIEIKYDGEKLVVAFNVNYFKDVLSALNTSRVKIELADANSSALISGVGDDENIYVVMPMRL